MAAAGECVHVWAVHCECSFARVGVCVAAPGVVRASETVSTRELLLAEKLQFPSQGVAAAATAAAAAAAAAVVVVVVVAAAAAAAAAWGQSLFVKSRGLSRVTSHSGASSEEEGSALFARQSLHVVERRLLTWL